MNPEFVYSAALLKSYNISDQSIAIFLLVLKG